MASANTWAQLELMLKAKIIEAMSDKAMGQDVVEEVQAHIRDDVYHVYHPTMYETTGEFHDSVVSTQPMVYGNEINITVHHDASKMNPRPEWYHQSVVDETPSAESLAEIIEYGLTGDIFHGTKDGEAFMLPRPYMDNSRADLENGLAKEMLKKRLREQGLTVL